MSAYLRLFGRAWLIVFLTAMNVVFLSRGLVLPAFLSGWGISFVWWGNTHRAAFPIKYGGLCYATGAACGTVSGLFFARLIPS